MSFAHLSVEYTFADLAVGIRDVAAHLQTVRNALRLPEADGRHVALYGMQEALLGVGLTVHSIAGIGLTTHIRTAAEVKASFQNYAYVSGKDDAALLTIAETVWRLSLLSLCHFKVDALFQNLLRALGSSPGRSGFGANSRSLLSIVTLPDAPRVSSVLAGFTHVRNSLHNNGIHRGPAWGPWHTGGLAFSFAPDQPVQCASFGHILAVLDATAGSLAELLAAPQIASLARVDDLYADSLTSA